MVRLLAAVTLLCLGACEQARGKQTAPAATPSSPLAPLLLRFRDSAAALGPLKFEGTAHTALREGDKLVHRDASGEVVVKTIVRGAERGI